jgi:hypothetical protein
MGVKGWRGGQVGTAADVFAAFNWYDTFARKYQNALLLIAVDIGFYSPLPPSWQSSMCVILDIVSERTTQP